MLLLQFRTHVVAKQHIVSILYLRCPHTTTSIMLMMLRWSFNSLFEMLCNHPLAKRPLSTTRVSILYLRCMIVGTGIGVGLGRYSVSILYLRCPATSKQSLGRRHRGFNSLFEMLEFRWTGWRCDGRGLVSILYLRCAAAEGGGGLHLSRVTVSILYLRCRLDTAGHTLRCSSRCCGGFQFSI